MLLSRIAPQHTRLLLTNEIGDLLIFKAGVEKFKNPLNEVTLYTFHSTQLHCEKSIMTEYLLLLTNKLNKPESCWIDFRICMA